MKAIAIKILDTGKEIINDYVLARLSYFAQEQGIEVQASCVDSIELCKPEDQVVCVVDRLLLSRYINMQALEPFFASRKGHKVFVLSFGVDYSKLPVYMQQASVWAYPENSYSDQVSIHLELPFYREQINAALLDILPLLKEARPLMEKCVLLTPGDGNAKTEYLKVLRELEHRNYKVQVAQADEAISPDEFDLIVQFISHQDLSQLNPEPLALVLNQKIASVLGEDNQKLKRFIYIPPITEETTDEVIHKIDQFKRDKASLQHAEILQTPTERLKDILLKSLQHSHIENIAEHFEDKVYFIFRKKEDIQVKEMLKQCEELDIKICYPHQEMNKLELLNYHQKCLSECQSVLIHNANHENWLSRKVNDVLKAPGWGREKSFDKKVIVGDALKENNELSELAGFTYSKHITKDLFN